MQLNLNQISFSYPNSSQMVLDGVNVTFSEGWTGIIGDNGCGKSTLALIAAGIMEPQGGSVTPRLFASYCPQDSSLVPDNLNEFASDWGKQAILLRKELHIADEDLFVYSTLSGGRQKRIQIACALYRQPDVLVMDEPTNDLDETTRQSVEAVLRSYRGIGLLISHDRALLNALVSCCLMFEGSRIVMRAGGYEEAASQARLEQKTRARLQENAKQEVKRLKAETARRNAEAARSKSRLSAHSLAKGDSDKRERLGRAKVSGKDSHAGRASAVMKKRLEGMEEDLSSKQLEKRYDPTLTVQAGIARAKSVVHAEEGILQKGSFQIKLPELWVGPTDHIGISGANGTGKSVTIQHLLSLVRETVSVASIPQSVDRSMREAALASLKDMSASERGKALSIVAKLNSDPDCLLDGSDVSPGELRKLMIAEQLLKEPELLVLDEPTNHLDIGSIEALQELLKSYPGAIILVTHDRCLMDAVAPIQWWIEALEAEQKQNDALGAVSHTAGEYVLRTK